MTLSPIGVNVDITAIQDKDLFYRRMDALNPAVFVARVISFNDADKIEALAARYPNARIHARLYTRDEGNYHLRPEAKDDHRPRVAEPEDCINAFGRLGKRNMSLYLLNEINDKGDEKNPDAVPRLNDWIIRACNHATKTETYITVPNWGVQMPYPDGRFDDALRAMSANRKYVTFGFHEYLPRRDKDGNLRIGYFVNTLSRFKSMGLPAPKFVNSEFGYDGADGSGLSHFKSRGITDKQAAIDFIDVIEKDYRPYIDDGTLEGATLFSYTDWNGFQLEPLEEFWNTLLGWRYVRVPVSTPPPPVVVPPVPTVPVPADPGTPARKIIRTPQDFVNLRTVANGVDVGDVPNGTELTVYSKYEIVGIDKHYYVHLDNGGHGWVSNQAGKVAFEDVPIITLPPPDFPNLIPTDAYLERRYIKLRREIDDLMKMLEEKKLEEAEIIALRKQLGVAA